MINDPTAKTFMDNLKISTDEMKETVSSIISIKVNGKKPR